MWIMALSRMQSGQGAMRASASEPVERFAGSDAGRRSAFTDRAGLAIVGFIFAGVTVVVIATAALVVHRHLNAGNALEQGASAASASAARQR